MHKSYISLQELQDKYKHLPEHNCWTSKDILAWYRTYRINGIEKNGEIPIEEESYNRLINKSLEGK
ncbi:hypothetical protein [Fulvivirga sediminis]|uniref:Uncharacterized protein n=1 Tax=Fulvivirga sediminis TaxID=2803949 RepID=A0A937FDF5_9BACT|nr:hypothetical protein [Fulvivirga sediminis]MBL3658875.1 hypothetical protein [Fulvivirga sediminis]